MSCKITLKNNNHNEWIESQEDFGLDRLIVKVFISSATNKSYFYVRVSNEDPDVHSSDRFLINIEGEYLPTSCFSKNLLSLHIEPVISSDIAYNSSTFFAKEINKDATIHISASKIDQNSEQFKSPAGINLLGLYDNALYYDVVLVGANKNETEDSMEELSTREETLDIHVPRKIKALSHPSK